MTECPKNRRCSTDSGGFLCTSNVAVAMIELAHDVFDIHEYLEV